MLPLFVTPSTLHPLAELVSLRTSPKTQRDVRETLRPQSLWSLQNSVMSTEVSIPYSFSMPPFFFLLCLLLLLSFASWHHLPKENPASDLCLSLCGELQEDKSYLNFGFMFMSLSLNNQVIKTKKQTNKTFWRLHYNGHCFYETGHDFQAPAWVTSPPRL